MTDERFIFFQNQYLPLKFNLEDENFQHSNLKKPFHQILDKYPCTKFISLPETLSSTSVPRPLCRTQQTQSRDSVPCPCSLPGGYSYKAHTACWTQSLSQCHRAPEAAAWAWQSWTAFLGWTACPVHRYCYAQRSCPHSYYYCRY